MRKKKRRQLHYDVISLYDGTVLGAYTVRKPMPRIIKRDRLVIDQDGVCAERLGAGQELSDIHNDTRARFQDIIAIRLNTRRAIRDIVAPALAEIRAEVAAVRSQLNQIERLLNELRGN